MDKENPFKLYCGYIDFARPIQTKLRVDELEEKVRHLEALLKQRIEEFEMS